MIICNVNSGLKAGHELDGTALTLYVPGIGDVTVDLQDKQLDEGIVLNFCFDRSYDRIVEGVGMWYIANVKIPAKEYHATDTGEVDGEGNPIVVTEPLPLNTGNVELCLWGLPGAISAMQEETEEQTEGE